MQSTSCKMQAGWITSWNQDFWENNNLRYADDTTLMAVSEEELKRFLMKVKGESEKASLKFNIQKTKIMTFGMITSWQMKGKKWKQWQLFFLGSKITVDGDCSHEIRRYLLLERKALTNLVQFSSVAQSCLTLCDPWTAACQASLSITNSRSPHKPWHKSVMPSNHLILCRPLLLFPSIFPSIRVFSNGQFFTTGGQSIGVSASKSVLPMNTQDWSSLGLGYGAQ